METRLEYLESLLGDTADRHAQSIEDAKAQLGDVRAALDSCAKTEHHCSLDQRVGYLEGFLGESADKHEEHKTTMETRLEYMESLFGNSADKHAKEIEEAHAK